MLAWIKKKKEILQVVSCFVFFIANTGCDEDGADRSESCKRGVNGDVHRFLTYHPPLHLLTPNFIF